VVQGGNRVIRFQAGVYQLLIEGANNAVKTGVDRANTVAIFAGGLDHPAGRGVDYGGYSARLGIKGILFGHRYLPGNPWPAGAPYALVGVSIQWIS
jgi:hypothetical protein